MPVLIPDLEVTAGPYPDHLKEIAGPYPGLLTRTARLIENQERTAAP